MWVPASCRRPCLSGSRLGLAIEEQRLTDQRLDHFGIERLGDQERRLRALACQQPFGEGGDEDHRDGVDDRISLTASMPELPSANWMSASTIFGRALLNSAVASAWVRAVPTTRWPRLSHHFLDVHGDQRLVFDDQHVGRHLARNLGARLRDQRRELAVGDVEDFGGLLVGEAFDRDQQEGLARPRRKRRQIGRGALLPSRMSASRAAP